MDDELKKNLGSAEIWLRVLYMLLFAVILYFSAFVVGAVVLIQLLFVLISGQKNERLLNFSVSLFTFIHQALRFLGFATEEKPFPFNDWPQLEASAEAEAESSEQ